MNLSPPARTFFALATSAAVVTASLVLTTQATASTHPTVTVTDLTPAPSPLVLSERHVGTVTFTFRVTSSVGQAGAPTLQDDTTGIGFAETSSTLVKGNHHRGTWEATATFAAFMDGSHQPKVRVCVTTNSCVTRALTTSVVVKGSNWPTLTRVTQKPGRLAAGKVTGAVAHGAVVYSDSRRPVRGISIRLLHHVGEPGRLVDRTDRHGQFTSPWPWTNPGEDSARLVAVLPTVSGVSFDRAVLGNPATAFRVMRPKAKSVASTGKRYVVTGKISPGFPASSLGTVRLQQRQGSRWVTRDQARVRPVRANSGHVLNLARYRLTTSFSNVAMQTLRVVKPASMCGTGHCRVSQGHSSPFEVAVGNRKYFVEQRLDRLGVPVGSVDGVVDVRARQAFCAWRDMTGQSPSRNGLTNSLARSVMSHTKLPKPKRSNGLYVDKTCQVLFQVKHHSFRRVVWASSGQPGFDTPNGTGHIFRKVHGWVESTLYPGAFMLDPMFFFPSRPAIALHGSVTNDLVLPYPASHGCVRVWRPTIRKIYNESPLGTKVKVYGKY